jgi:hypothetical protein
MLFYETTIQFLELEKKFDYAISSKNTVNYIDLGILKLHNCRDTLLVTPILINYARLVLP